MTAPSNNGYVQLEERAGRGSLCRRHLRFVCTFSCVGFVVVSWNFVMMAVQGSSGPHMQQTTEAIYNLLSWPLHLQQFRSKSGIAKGTVGKSKLRLGFHAGFPHSGPLMNPLDRKGYGYKAHPDETQLIAESSAEVTKLIKRNLSIDTMLQEAGSGQFEKWNEIVMADPKRFFNDDEAWKTAVIMANGNRTLEPGWPFYIEDQTNLEGGKMLPCGTKGYCGWARNGLATGFRLPVRDICLRLTANFRDKFAVGDDWDNNGFRCTQAYEWAGLISHNPTKEAGMELICEASNAELRDFFKYQFTKDPFDPLNIGTMSLMVSVAKEGLRAIDDACGPEKKDDMFPRNMPGDPGFDTMITEVVPKDVMPDYKRMPVEKDKTEVRNPWLDDFPQ
eukprot:gnl/MRDRNA2_/MRDRNA2_31827_c0_seq1.p1 gnl/MRDRNA2_/MRDRNA2_31827_c0~~gnl/MRDRNA2_/MRDRNA2_31827_c0_seq1.p1  ORF type:complete len:390 (+),score=52.43 gnl/MRDRNA2_/MRDRNA2_31827_c0_seq1:109-1278(+)